VMSWDEQGATLIPSDQLSDRGKAAIKKVKIKKTTRRIFEGDSAGEEVTVETEVELHDRHAALQKLAGKLGVYPQPLVKLLEDMATQGILVHDQADVVLQGLEGIQEQLSELPGKFPERN
jgi:hypothetical protein